MRPTAPVRVVSDGGSETLSVAARRQRLVAEVARQLRLRCGLGGGGPVVLGVSGGPDSLALLLACVAIRDRHSGRSGQLLPTAAHVHHHLRPTADDDAEFVAQVCRRYDVKLHVQHVHPREEPGNLAASARRLRYAALARTARTVGAAHVAVGHHAEDQLETMLIALCRGSGLEGVSGMAWTRPLGDDASGIDSSGDSCGGVSLVRPLLGVSKADCQSMCDAAGITWHNDPTNTDPDTARGRIRRDIMPILEILWPDCCRRSTGTADLITAAAVLLDERISSVFGPPERRSWPRAHLAAQPLAIIAGGLRRAVIDECRGGDRADRASRGGGPPVDLGQRHILPAAEAVVDGERRPRRFEAAGGVNIIVHAQKVEIERLEEGHGSERNGEEAA